MQFERLVALAQDADTSVLGETLGVHAEAVLSVKRSERPDYRALTELQEMTIRDFAGLAESRQIRPSRMWAALEHRHGPLGFPEQPLGPRLP